MAQKEILVSMNGLSFPVFADELNIQHTPYRRRYLVSSSNEYFQKLTGNADMLIALSPRSAYASKPDYVSEAEHSELMEAIYQALIEELAVSI